MPSFQTKLKITGLKPGNAPESVMAAAVEALETRHHVESNQLDIVGRRTPDQPALHSGRPGLLGRERRSPDVGSMMRDAVERVAITGSLFVLRRSRGRWSPV